MGLSHTQSGSVCSGRVQEEFLDPLRTMTAFNQSLCRGSYARRSVLCVIISGLNVISRATVHLKHLRGIITQEIISEKQDRQLSSQ